MMMMHFNILCYSKLTKVHDHHRLYKLQCIKPLPESYVVHALPSAADNQSIPGNSLINAGDVDRVWLIATEL